MSLLRRVAATEDHTVYGEESDSDRKEVTSRAQKDHKEIKRDRAMFATKESSRYPVCDTGHHTQGCHTFATLRPEERLKEAIKLRLLYGLEAGYITREC